MIDPRAPDFQATPAAGASRSEYVLSGPEVPLVSIITPFFETGELFHQTARSVFDQSLQAWEWLIVNDASVSSAALGVLAQYRHADARITVIDLPQRLGPAAARNVGVSHARTPYALLLDSDDLLEPTAAEKWWWCLTSYEEFAFVKGFSVGFGAMSYLATRGFHDESRFLDGNRADITCLVRTAAVVAAGGFPESNRDGLEDWEFWLRCADAGLWGGTVPEFLSWYRRRDDDAVRWPNWQGDEGSTALRARLRTQFAALYQDGRRFPSPSPAQIRRGPVVAAPEGNRLRRQAPRVLLVVPWLAAGGSDRVNLALTEYLTAAGWSVSLVSTLQSENVWAPLFTRITPDVFSLPNVVRLSDYPRVLEYLIRSREIDVVLLSNSEMAYRLIPVLRERCPHVGVVDLCHMEQEEWLDGGYPRMSIDAAPFLDRTVVTSEHLRDWMASRGRNPRDLAVSATGVRVPGVAEVEAARTKTRHAWGAPATPVVLFAGRMVEQKQPLLFVKILQRLADHGVAFSSIVAGDGPLLPAMRAEVHKAGLASRVGFLGEVGPAEMEDVLCGSDVLCLPSRWEGVAIVLQEAMARGVPVVAADVGGQRELVSTDCGVLVPPGDGDAVVEAYTAALRRMLEDESWRRDLGARARERITGHFSLQQMGTRMDGILRQAIDAGRSRGTTPANSRAADGPHADPAAIIESMQSQYVPYRQWVHAVAARGTESPSSVNARLFAALTVLEPAYRWGLRRGWTWLPALRRRLRTVTRTVLRLDR